jgi:hypothetical protein
MEDCFIFFFSSQESGAGGQADRQNGKDKHQAELSLYMK